jgi:hypothetical protein
VAFHVCIGGFAGPPVRSQRGKFADDESFDIRLSGFFVVEICSNVADMRIRERDDLAGITGIGENFLIAGETGIENDFAATAGASTSGAAVKNSPVLERECRADCGDLVQCVLPMSSFGCRVNRG